MKRLLLFNCILLLFFLGRTSAQQTSEKIDVLIVDGFSNHDWKQTTKVVKQILENSALFQVSVSTSPSEPEDENWASWNPKFKKFDVVMLNCNNINNKAIRWPSKVQKSLENYLKTGGGLYVLHSANNAFAEWPQYNVMIGLGWRTPEQGVALQVLDDGEILEIPAGEGKATYHGPRHDEIVHVLVDHPINKGFPKTWKTPNMELYKFARGPAQNLTILSYAKDTDTNINWPVEWTVSYGKGRVYNSTMGHLWKGETYPDSYRCIGFQTTLIRATEWLGTGKTSYPVPENFPSESNISLLKN